MRSTIGVASPVSQSSSQYLSLICSFTSRYFFLFFQLVKDCASPIHCSVLDPVQVRDKGCSDPSPDIEPWRTSTILKMAEKCPPGALLLLLEKPIARHLPITGAIQGLNDIVVICVLWVFQKLARVWRPWRKAPGKV